MAVMFGTQVFVGEKLLVVPVCKALVEGWVVCPKLEGHAEGN